MQTETGPIKSAVAEYDHLTLLLGVNAACGAIQHMASSIACVAIEQKMLGSQLQVNVRQLNVLAVEHHREVLREAIAGLDAVMQDLGDYMNDCDICDETDEWISPAFVAIRDLLGKDGDTNAD